MIHQNLAANPDVLFSDLGEGGILFDLNSKRYFSLNASASAAWSYLEAGGSLAELERSLRNAQPVPDTGDAYGLGEFAAFLVREKLAEPGSATVAVPVPSLADAWERPRIEPHGNPLSDVILSPFDPTVPIPE